MKINVELSPEEEDTLTAMYCWAIKAAYDSKSEYGKRFEVLAAKLDPHFHLEEEYRGI